MRQDHCKPPGFQYLALGRANISDNSSKSEGRIQSTSYKDAGVDVNACGGVVENVPRPDQLGAELEAWPLPAVFFWIAAEWRAGTGEGTPAVIARGPEAAWNA